MATSDDKRALFGGARADATDWGTRPKPTGKQDALGNKIPDPEEELRLIEREIHEIKAAFEQFLLGTERRSPVRRRDLLWERLRKFKTADVKMSTGVKYRLEQTWSKYAALDRMWTRSLVEKENGTYARDEFKARLRAQPRAEPEAPRAIAPPARPSMLTDGQLKTLYDTYVIARRRTNEPTDNLTIQTLSKHLDKQVPQMLKQFECKAVDFKVVIKNGKALLKAIPRK